MESFKLSGDASRISRIVRRRSGRQVKTSFVLPKTMTPSSVKRMELAELADVAFLRQTCKPRMRVGGRTIRVADLFSGCGAMSLGVREACRALGVGFRSVVAIDSDHNAMNAYSANFPEASVDDANLGRLLRGKLGLPVTKGERKLIRQAGRIDLLVAGPPCQGHSDLNNKTRRRDPKNGLYFRIARFAEIIRPRHIIVENVPAVLHDHGRVVAKTKNALEGLGYAVRESVVTLADLGVPQMRRRHVLVASLTRTINPADAVTLYQKKRRTVRWAISDLRNRRHEPGVDRRPKLTDAAVRRIRYLFTHGLYELPNPLRPKCQRNNNHTYQSVYGRLRWNEPAPTITSGFMCMGQGRFVHPSQRRTLTAREAARLQFIPDYFSYGNAEGAVALAEMIGNAVPPKLSYVISIELFR
jgi:DNA (cytosine-5)-methyltransferase 1